MSTAAKTTWQNEISQKGEFVRSDAGWRNWIKKDGSTPFQPEAGRYHLYVSYACPWANRCLAMRSLKGLEDVIGVSVVHPTMQRTRPDLDEHVGWAFAKPKDPPFTSAWGVGSFECDAALVPDDVNGAKFIRDLYEKAKDSVGKYSVPVLWDKKLNTICSNESSEIIRMFNSEFNDVAKHPQLDLYPEALSKQIDEVNEWTYPSINNGVYRCGFAKSQEAHEKASYELFEALDRVESILSKQRYLTGPRFTEADLRLFMTLVRFDEVYVVHFKCNQKRIADLPNTHGYVKEICQMPAIQKVINMDHIKVHYYSSHQSINPYALVPVGPGVVKELLTPHDRHRFPKE
ncbi:unnamed protein product [Vitrella brassicaformis CCMP3155]|uniref:GST C-terminal domain-containing protein n=1 Tax=Vitrella brassicaformis (strain CCMP3155) TaxID=1169540 RepID=A0A0G4G2L3_VITBC|nr:unnamed protein product [Vitrella brassicaformis CCMP3155]|eukprot:CEM22098.1 unnamed protein product [Vitrella brassicaformis CCMP3155]